MKIPESRVLIAVVLAAASTVAQAQGNRLSSEQRQAMEQRIEATAQADKEACEPLHGNVQDVCRIQAKWKERIAKADLEFKQSGSDSDRAKLVDMKAEAEYEIARERCENGPANSWDACKQRAQKQQSGDIRRKPGY
jgi:tellurite resistance protein